MKCLQSNGPTRMKVKITLRDMNVHLYKRATNSSCLGGERSQRNSIFTTTIQIPAELNHFQAVEYSGLIWVIGSFMTNSFPNEMPADSVVVYDPANDVWMNGPPIPVQRRRGGGGLQFFNGKLYLVGGNTVGHSGWCVPWLDEFDATTGTWTALPDAPRPRDHFHAAVVGNKLYAAGGRCTSRYNVFGDTIEEVDVFDFESRKWLTTDDLTSSLPDNLPLPRGGAAVAVLDERIILMGGESDEQLDEYDTVNELNMGTGTWSTLAPMNHPRHGTQAIVSGEGIYISGGSPHRGDGNQRNMEVYNKKDAPGGLSSTAGVLSAPSAISADGEPTLVTIQHVSGNQGVIVQSISLLGESAGDFALPGNVTAPLLIEQGSSLDLFIEYTGIEDSNSSAQLVLTYSSNQTISIDLSERSVSAVQTASFYSPSHSPSQSPSRLPSQMPSRVPSLHPTLSIPISNAPTSEPTSRSSYAPSQSPNEHSAGPHIDLIIDAGAVDEDTSFVTADEMWTFGVPNSVEIEETDTPVYFRTHRSGPSFTYTIDGLEAGAMYIATLGFAEIYSKACEIGKRMMNININGNAAVRLDLDVFKEAGCNNAHLESFQVAASAAGKLEIIISATVENAMVSLIEVMPSPGPLSTATSPPTGRATLSPSPSQMPSLRPSHRPSSSPTRGDVLIDAGSVNEDKSIITAEKMWSFGVLNDVSITGTDVPEYFRTHRSGPGFTYKIEGLEAEALYTISLGFAEIYSKACMGGKRIMTISINGGIKQVGLDMFKEAGCNSALMKRYTVATSAEGKLEITISASVENAMVSLIEVVRSKAPVPNEIPPAGSVTLSPSPSPMPSLRPSHRLSPSSTREKILIDAGSENEDTSIITAQEMWRFGVLDDVSITGTDTPGYFRTHRSGPSFTYTIDRLEAGAMHTVSLGFAEIYSKACKVGKRIMDVNINGNAVVKSDLDVFKEAGCNAAYLESFQVPASAEGSLEITISASVENAMVSLIEVVLSPDPVPNAIPPTGRATLSPSPSPMPSLRPSHRLSPSSTREKILIDAGSENEDTSIITAQEMWRFGVLVDVSITGTDTPGYFRTHRSGPSFTYTIDRLEAGAMHTVSLGFAEIYSKACKVGKRIMNININGNAVVRSDLDVFKEAGCNAAYLESFQVPASAEGSLEITISASVENAMVSLIEVVLSPDPVPNAIPPTGRATLSPSPSPMPSLRPSHRLSPSSTREKILIDAGSENEDTSIITAQEMWRFGVLDDVSITGTDTPGYFRTHRSGPSSTYTIDRLEAGAMHTVSLGFAEIYSKACKVGKRIMDVSINGDIKQDDLDVFNETGLRAHEALRYRSECRRQPRDNNFCLGRKRHGLPNRGCAEPGSSTSYNSANCIPESGKRDYKCRISKRRHFKDHSRRDLDVRSSRRRINFWDEYTGILSQSSLRPEFHLYD